MPLSRERRAHRLGERRHQCGELARQHSRARHARRRERLERRQHFRIGRRGLGSGELGDERRAALDRRIERARDDHEPQRTIGAALVARMRAKLRLHRLRGALERGDAIGQRFDLRRLDSRCPAPASSSTRRRPPRRRPRACAPRPRSRQCRHCAGRARRRARPSALRSPSSVAMRFASAGSVTGGRGVAITVSKRATRPASSSTAFESLAISGGFAASVAQLIFDAREPRVDGHQTLVAARKHAGQCQHQQSEHHAAGDGGRHRPREIRQKSDGSHARSRSDDATAMRPRPRPTSPWPIRRRPRSPSDRWSAAAARVVPPARPGAHWNWSCHAHWRFIRSPRHTIKSGASECLIWWAFSPSPGRAGRPPPDGRPSL